MKRLIILFTLLIVFFLISGCSAGQYGYSITFRNYSDKNVTMQFGGKYIYCLSGQTFTSYYSIGVYGKVYVFFRDVSEIPVEKYRIVDNGELKTIRGMILDKGFAYTVSLYLSSGKYYWNVDAVYSGDQSEALATPQYVFEDE